MTKGAQARAGSRGGSTDALRIFINYRREDASGHAGRLYDALTGRFGDDQVFMDIDTIEPGLDFSEVVKGGVGSCDVLIALIGRQWLTCVDAHGRRRLDKPEDFVRLEIQTALDRDVRVIPALVQGADMPSSERLPRALRKLAFRHAVELSDARWRYDVGRLIETLERVEREKAPQEEPDSAALVGDEERVIEPKPARRSLGAALPLLAQRRRAALGIAGVLVVAVGGFVGLRGLGGSGGDEARTAPPAGPPLGDVGDLVYKSIGGHGLFRIKPDGSGVERLYDTSDVVAPSWSSDRSKVAFQRGFDGPIMILSGGKLRVLAPGGKSTYDDSYPDWSPDGKKIAFSSNRAASCPTCSDIYVVNPDGTGLKQLTTTGRDSDPDWSPDGTQIVFVSSRESPADCPGCTELWAMNADGTGLRRLTTDSVSEYSPAWSPDGKKLVFTGFIKDGSCTQACNNEIYVMTPGVTGVTRLTNDPENDQLPAWSADGSRIFFVSGRGPGQYDTDIYSMNASDGSDVVKLTTDGTSWEPDVARPAFRRSA